MHTTGYADLSNFLERLGVLPGSTLMVHSFLPSLGVLTNGLEGIYRALRDRLGPKGTLVVPAFSYSFCRGEEFDVRSTPSTVGSLTEFVRRQEGAVRSADPIFSVAAIGTQAREVTRIPEPVCFGKGSTFELLEKAGVQFLLIGIDYRKSLTYFIHLEKLHGVPYREDKKFSGILIDQNGNRRSATFTYYARREGATVRMDYNRVGNDFDETPACRRQDFAYGVHRLFAAGPLRNFAVQRLSQDPYCLTALPEPVPASAGHKSARER